MDFLMLTRGHVSTWGFFEYFCTSNFIFFPVLFFIKCGFVFCYHNELFNQPLSDVFNEQVRRVRVWFLISNCTCLSWMKLQKSHVSKVLRNYSFLKWFVVIKCFSMCKAEIGNFHHPTARNVNIISFYRKKKLI